MKHIGIKDQYRASIQRRIDAQRLQEKERWRGAMYLAGYAVECSLKAKLMERYRLRHLKDLQRLLAGRLRRDINVFTHSLPELMRWNSRSGEWTFG